VASILVNNLPRKVDRALIGPIRLAGRKPVSLAGTMTSLGASLIRYDLKIKLFPK